ncbi:MAG: amidohydrolase family protein [Myxococcota bacterium]
MIATLAVGACATEGEALAGDEVLVGAHLVGTGDAKLDGTVASVLVKDGVIAAIGKAADAAKKHGTPARDVSGKWLAPAFIDSHVHLVYWDVSAELPAAGVVAAVDLAAPLDRFFGHDWGKLHVIGAGPMITAPGGYPTTSWGRDGYGAECATAAAAVSAVDAALDRGARIVKIPLAAGPDLAEDVARAAVDEAHRRHALVAVHALTDEAAAHGAALGADVLAHMPVAAMADATVTAWSTRTVIPTLAAFGGTTNAVENLRRVRAAGARILYGTDLGNDRVAGIDERELELMSAAGMDGQAILESGTKDPAAFWGFVDLGRIAVGKSASLLVLDADPRATPATLAHPSAVILP